MEFITFLLLYALYTWLDQPSPIVPPQMKDPLEGSHSDLPPLLDDRMHERLAKHFIYPTLSVSRLGEFLPLSR